MPAVSFYLKKEVLAAVRARAAARDIPVSRLISRAVEDYLRSDEAAGARKRVLENIGKALDRSGWKDLHQERTAADAGRD